MHEAETHARTSFLTLTYNEKSLPSNGSLDRQHFPLFMKKLRRSEERRAAAENASPRSFRYFHCGEYGEETSRPHYHAAFFGDDFREDSKPWHYTRGNHTWTNDRLDQVWSHGRVVVGSLTVESAQYVARYIMKKVNGPMAEAHYQGRTPEYVTMSRKPGLGEPWYRKFKTDVYPSDQVVIGKHTRRPPRYYDFLLEKDEPQLLAELQLSRKSKGAIFAHDQDELDRREKTQQYRLNRHKRDIEFKTK